jgi:hypothetical protein
MKQPSYHCAGGILSVKWHTEPGFVSDWHDDSDHKLVCRASVATRPWRPYVDHFPWERSLGCQVERVRYTATWSESSEPYSFAYGIKPRCVLAPRVWAVSRCSPSACRLAPFAIVHHCKRVRIAPGKDKLKKWNLAANFGPNTADPCFHGRIHKQRIERCS